MGGYVHMRVYVCMFVCMCVCADARRMCGYVWMMLCVCACGECVCEYMCMCMELCMRMCIGFLFVYVADAWTRVYGVICMCMDMGDSRRRM